MAFKVLLARESLSREKQAALANLTTHPGYRVFRDDLIPAAVKQATDDLMALNPDDPEYSRKVQSKQQWATTVQQVCEALVRSIEVHAEAATGNN